MDSTEFDATLEKLGEQVSQFTTITNNHKESNSFNGNNVLHKLNFKSPLVYYGAISLGILFILLLWKPKFITEEVSIDGNLPEQKLSYQKLVIATIILTALIAIIMFINSYRSSDATTAAVTSS